MTIKTANTLRLDCKDLLIDGIVYINNVNAQIRRKGSSQIWVNGRNGALLRETSVAGYHTLWSLKTTNGSWDFGEYNAGSAWNNIPVLSYITDSNYNSGNDKPTYQIKFPLASGTVALTSDIANYSVKYATNAGNADTLDGEHASNFVRAGSFESADLNKLDTYSFIKSVYSTNKDTSPKGNIGWYNVIQAVHRNGATDGPDFIGQIALGMTINTDDMFFRCKRTDPWKTVIHSGNITNYYWANVKISTSSSTTTSPTVHTLTATRVCVGYDPGIDNSISCSNWFRSSGNTGWYNTTYKGGWYMSDTSWIRTYNNVGIYTDQIYADNSIRMGSIRLEKTNEINSSNNLLINYGSSTDVSLCKGGGNVGIGTTVPGQKLDVNGSIITNGFIIRPYYLSISNSLPSINPGDGYKYKCLEIGRTIDISCIIADRVGLTNERGFLIKFNRGYDGQIILLKDLQNYGSGNGYFWVMPSQCDIIKADGSSILVGQNQISNIYDDGRSRFLVYSSFYNVWIEFLCG